MKAYGIKHKQTGLYFCGFGESGSCLWGDESHAYAFESRMMAEGQSSLFICNGIKVQRKAVAI
jgi:hypothetical protein